MKTALIIIGTVLLLVFGSCSSDNLRKPETVVDRYKSLSVEKLGDGVEWIPNSTKTAVLCLKRTKPTDRYPQHRVAFLVYDAQTDKITFEDEIPNGSVGWKDDQSVIVEIVPGIEKEDDPVVPSRRGYLVDVRTGRKTDLANTIDR